MVFLYMHKVKGKGKGRGAGKGKGGMGKSGVKNGTSVTGIETPDEYVERMVERYKSAQTPKGRDKVDISVIMNQSVGKIFKEHRNRYEIEKNK